MKVVYKKRFQIISYAGNGMEIDLCEYQDVHCDVVISQWCQCIMYVNNCLPKLCFDVHYHITVQYYCINGCRYKSP